MKDLYLMRHGQTMFNLQGRVQGACDSPLTELGREQAAQARAYFEGAGIQFSSYFSSTQERASDTLEIVAQTEDYKRLKGLKEWNFGLFEGQPEMLQPKRRPGAKSFEDLHVPYGGESAQEVGQRMITCLSQVMQEEEGPVLAVSHGGAMYAFLLELGLEVPAGARFGNCAICHYRYDEEKGFSLLEVIDPLSGEIYEGK